MTTVLLERPGMVAIMEAWPQECGKAVTVGGGREDSSRDVVAAEELAMVLLMRDRSQALDSAP